MDEARLVEQLRRMRPDEAYKREAVRLAKASTKSVPAIARELGIGNSTLYRWIAKYPGGSEDKPQVPARRKPVPGKMSARKASAVREPDELDRLRKENLFLRDENDILRRAALAFARTSYPVPD